MPSLTRSRRLFTVVSLLSLWSLVLNSVLSVSWAHAQTHAGLPSGIGPVDSRRAEQTFAQAVAAHATLQASTPLQALTITGLRGCQLALPERVYLPIAIANRSAISSPNRPPTAPGDGALSTTAPLNHPNDVERGPDGSLYIADRSNHRIRKVAPSGIISTVAGTGVAGFSGDGGPATHAQLFTPGGIVLGTDGSLYIADSGTQRIRRVGLDGIISTVAGTGEQGFGGDGGPATSAHLNVPEDLAFAPDGSLYIVEPYNHRVRKIDPDGIISTVAGTGVAGFNGDSRLAITAQLNYPQDIALGPDGSLYTGDYENQRVRKVAPNGIISTVAGTGVAGFSGDGGPATNAQFYRPADVHMDATGRLYITDFVNHRIRRVDLDGIVTTIAGTGVAGFSGDGGPATSAQFSDPRGLALAPDGSLYIADRSNHRIRCIGTDGVITTVVGIGSTTTTSISPMGMLPRRHH